MLSSIPVEFGQLTSLKDLNVRHNFITHIPSGWFPLTFLLLSFSFLYLLYSRIDSDNGIFGEGSQISTNKKRESTVVSLLIG